jgi:hypothetical protein
MDGRHEEREDRDATKKHVAFVIVASFALIASGP